MSLKVDAATRSFGLKNVCNTKGAIRHRGRKNKVGNIKEKKEIGRGNTAGGIL